MSPYGPLFSNSVDLAVAWVCVSVWVLIGTLVLRKRLTAASGRFEGICMAAALALFILSALNLAVFAVGLVFFRLIRSRLSLTAVSLVHLCVIRLSGLRIRWALTGGKSCAAA